MVSGAPDSIWAFWKRKARTCRICSNSYATLRASLLEPSVMTRKCGLRTSNHVCSATTLVERKAGSKEARSKDLRAEEHMDAILASALGAVNPKKVRSSWTVVVRN